MKNLKLNKKFIISPNIFIVFILFLIVISTNLINKSIKDNKTINNDINNKDSISNNVASINSKNNNETTSEDINLLYNNPNDEYLVLVNKEHSLEENYEPNDLVIPNIPLQTIKNKNLILYCVNLNLQNKKDIIDYNFEDEEIKDKIKFFFLDGSINYDNLTRIDKIKFKKSLKKNRAFNVVKLEKNINVDRSDKHTIKPIINYVLEKTY